MIVDERWTRLYREAFPRVYRAVAATLLDAEAAKDAMHDAFLITPLRNTRVCASPSSPGFTKWTVVVDGNTLPAVERSQTMYALVGPHYFALPWDADSARALSAGLGLGAPRC